MLQGDFPLFTKKKLTEIWSRFNKKKEQARLQKQQQTQQSGPQPAPAKPKNNVISQQQPKKDKPAAAVTNDMLEQLKMKFGK